MADGFNRVWPSVDDGEHGRDDSKEDTGHDAGDGADVELVEKELSLSVENPFRAQHFLWEVSVSQAEVKVCFIEKESEVDCSIGSLFILCGPLALGRHPVVGVEGGCQEADGQAAPEECHKYQAAPLEIVHFDSVSFCWSIL